MNIINNNLYIEDLKKIADDKNLNLKRLSNSNIFITGATGLIGSFLVDVLMYRNKVYKDNIKIFMLCRNEEKVKERFGYYKELSMYNGEVNNLLYYILGDVINEFNFDIKFDYIIHAASNTHPKQYSQLPISTITTNVLGLYNILNYSIKYKPKRVFMVSSVEIYGENNGNSDEFFEEDLGYINCNTLRAGYSESKRLCESMCQAYIVEKNLNIVIGRLCRIYGPTILKSDTKAMSQFINKALVNENIVLKSKGNQYYSYLYVADAVSAIFKILLDGENGEAYNISSENSNIKLKDCAEYLAKISNVRVVYEIPDELEKRGYSKATKAILNSNKLKKLNWKSYYDIEHGLNRTLKILKSINET